MGFAVPEKMLAWRLYGEGMENFGDGDQPCELPVPEIRDDELLVRIDAIGLCFSDVKLIRAGEAHPRVISKDLRHDPVIPGHEAAPGDGDHAHAHGLGAVEVVEAHGVGAGGVGGGVVEQQARDQAHGEVLEEKEGRHRQQHHEEAFDDGLAAPRPAAPHRLPPSSRRRRVSVPSSRFW